MPRSSRSVCAPARTASSFSFSECAVESSSHRLAAGEDLVAAVLLVPLGERRRHVHLLDDVAPADAGVVGAEGDFALLRGIRDDAHLGAAEVVVEQILEPHAGDEQEVPAVGAALLDVVLRPVAFDLAVLALFGRLGRAERLVELLQQVGQLEVRRRLERVVVADDRERHAEVRPEAAAAGVGDLLRRPWRAARP